MLESIFTFIFLFLAFCVCYFVPQAQDRDKIDFPKSYGLIFILSVVLTACVNIVI